MTVLLDTGAGGGNYASLAFIQAAQRFAFSGRRIISKRGRGLLHAANPAKDKVPPMTIVGTAILLLIFPPVDRVFKVRVRVVKDLPFGLILGAAYMRHYNSVLNFGGLRSFHPAGDSPSVPLLPAEQQRSPQPWRDGVNHLQPAGGTGGSLASGWAAARVASRSGRVRNQRTGEIVATTAKVDCSSRGPPPQDVFCAVEWCTSPQESGRAMPAEAALLMAMDLGNAAWEDSTSQQYPVYLAHRQSVPGRVSVEIDALTYGPRPYTAQLLVVFPLKPFDPEEVRRRPSEDHGDDDELLEERH